MASSVAPASEALPRRRAAARRSLPDLVARAIPPAALIAYGAVLASRAVALSAAVYLMADAPIGAFLGQTLLHQGGMTLPIHTEIVPLLLEGAVLGLPAGHVLAALVGPMLGVLAVAVLCWTLGRLGARWQLTAVLGLAAGPIVLWSTLFPTAHLYTLLTMAALAGACVALAAGRLNTLMIAAAAVAAGSALLGDQGFLLMGLLPLLTVAAWLSLRQRVWRPAAVGAAIAGAAGVLALGGAWLLLQHGLTLDTGAAFRGTQGPSAALVQTGIWLGAKSFGWMLSGAWYGASTVPLLDALLAVLGCAIPLVAPLALAQQLRRQGTSDERRVAYLVFWTAADLLVLVAFVGFGYAQSVSSGRYLIPCLFSAIATFPLLRFPRLPSIAPVLVGVIAVIQALGVLTVSTAALSGPAAPYDAAQVLSVIRSTGLTRGYADYWYSSPLTWASGDTVHVYPVVTGCSGGATLCAYRYTAASWYTPTNGPTFLVVRSQEICPFGDLSAAFGPPQRTVGVDAGTTLLVYPYDIATRFGAQPSICF